MAWVLQFRLHISSHLRRSQCRRCRDILLCRAAEWLFEPLRRRPADAPRLFFATCPLCDVYPSGSPVRSTACSCARPIARAHVISRIHDYDYDKDVRSYGCMGVCHRRCLLFEVVILPSPLLSDPTALALRRGAVCSNDHALQLPRGCCDGAGREHTPRVGASVLLQP